MTEEEIAKEAHSLLVQQGHRRGVWNRYPSILREADVRHVKAVLKVLAEDSSARDE